VRRGACGDDFLVVRWRRGSGEDRCGRPELLVRPFIVPLTIICSKSSAAVRLLSVPCKRSDMLLSFTKRAAAVILKGIETFIFTFNIIRHLYTRSVSGRHYSRIIPSISNL